MDRAQIPGTDERGMRRAMRDLVALSTLPAVWIGLGRDAIARSLGDALVSTLSLDWLYIRLADRATTGFVEVVRGGRPSHDASEQTVRAALAEVVLQAEEGEPPFAIPDPLGEGTLRIAVVRFGVGTDNGVLVAASRRPEFPTEQDRLLLGVGANQTAIVLQRRRVEEQVEEQREWLEVTLASIGDGVITADIEGRIILMNRVAEQLTGWSTAEAKGEPLDRVFTLLDASTRQRMLCPAPGGQVKAGVLMAKEGAERPVDVSASPLMAAGKRIGTVVTFRDVTQQREAEQARKRGEEALRRSEEHLRAVVETSPACIKLVGPDGTLLDMNSSGLAMVDADALEQVRGKSVYDLVAAEYRDAFRAFNERICRGEKGSMTFDIVGVRGTRRRMETFAAPLRGAGGQFVQLAVTVDVTDRARTEQDLKLHARVLESMVEGVSLSDENGVIVYTNPAEDRIFGYERGELIGQHVGVQNTYPPEENRRIVGEVIECLRRDGSWSGEFSNRKKDGTPFTTHARITAMETAGRRYFVCVQEDITERKRAETGLADARARLDAALEAGAVVTWTWDIPNNRLFADRNLARLFNLPASEAEGGALDSYTRSIHPDDLPRVMALLTRAVERDEVYEADYRILQSDGSIRWVEARGRAERDPTGRPVRMPGVLVDITERKRLEEELRLRLGQLAEADRRKEELVASLRESEEKLRLLADTIPQLAWMAQPDGHIFWYNRRWYEYTGTTAPEMEGWGWQSVHDPAVLPTVLERWKGSIASGKPFDMVFPLRGADGRFRPFLTRVAPLRGADERILYWFGTNTDISDIKRMEDALREADRRKDEFLATLAHELRNPLAPIRNSLELLKLPRVDAATARQAREMMERQVHSLVRLVDDLLDVARVMRGKIELRKAPVELATVVARAVETVQPLIDVQGHHLELDLPYESLLVDADAVRLAQVISNLLTNAARYTEPRGQIRLAAERQGDEAVLRVRDNGIGIAPEMLSQVFDLFVQGDHAFARAQGGLGIGLTLVKNLTQMHGGTVEAHSGGPGKGAEFVLRLPLVDRQPGEVGEPGGERPHESSARGRRVLIVDDNRDAAVSLATLLRHQGHDVQVAHDGPSALTLASSFVPYLVFLDLGMPDMDGYEVARRLRHQPGLESVVLVALTGWGQEEARRRTAAAGFHHHLVKPPEPSAVARILE
ncbi:MAG TPA: PAS domain S-box protein [Burkholderiales bacterium]|nr:PAS domain S-box protein [Burkholderiales bacterium]